MKRKKASAAHARRDKFVTEKERPNPWPDPDPKLDRDRDLSRSARLNSNPNLNPNFRLLAAISVVANQIYGCRPKRRKAERNFGRRPNFFSTSVPEQTKQVARGGKTTSRVGSTIFSKTRPKMLVATRNL